MTDHRQPIRPSRWALRGLLGGAFLLVLAGGVARGDLIFLKDGTVLQGVIKRESKLEVDPVTKEPFTVPSGHMWIDDGPRRIYYAQNQVGRVEQKVSPNEERIGYKHKDTIINPIGMMYYEAPDPAPFDDHWRRSLLVRGGGRETKIGQAITVLSPYWTRVEATQVFQWASFHMTRELGEEQVRRLIRSHPDFAEPDRMKEEDKAARRFRYVDFFTQAGWYAEAELELQRIKDDLPTQKEKAEAGLKVLRGIIAREKYEEIKRFHNAGMYALVRARLEKFPMDAASETLQGDVREFQSEYNKAFDKVVETKLLLGELAGDLAAANREVFTDAAKTIADELHPGNQERLDTFLGQARQWSRLKKQSAKPELNAEQVLSLGISGWLLGSAASENKVETGLRLWKARAFALQVLRGETPAVRQQLIAAYAAQPASDQAASDWFVQMIPHLPPAFAEEETGPAAMELTVGGGRGAGSYAVQLPREYRHSRKYPVLIALHDANEKGDAMIRRWADAVDEGYIVVAPHWHANGGYQYSGEEHDLVMSALRDVRARFQVDSDRVFLHGFGQGAAMAYDVGLSHPDQFAGLVPMSGTPDYFSLKYWRNSLYMPLYVITGERLGESLKKTKSLFDAFILNNYASFWVQYKGRGIEWFGGEVPLVLDWMRNKTRAFPMRQLGNDDAAKGPKGEFCCMRASDSKFYWLSSNFILPQCLTTAQAFQPGTLPATFAARVDSDTNTIKIKVAGVKQTTIWLGRNSKGETTIDFDRPVTVQVGLTVKIANKKMPPSLAVLLEDLALRGDRQQLFLGRIDLNF